MYYAEKVDEREFNLNRNVREMLAMIREEKVSNDEINYNILKLTKHSRDRAREIIGCSDIDALDRVKDILKNSTRIGEQLAYDGRINVLFAYNQYAIYLSPNLEHVVTVCKFTEVSYNPIKKMLKDLQKKYSMDELKRVLINLHRNAWKSIEDRENQVIDDLLKIEGEATKEIDRLSTLLNDDFYKTKDYEKHLKKRISEERLKLKSAGKKLFYLKKEKRHIGKSLASLL